MKKYLVIDANGDISFNLARKNKLDELFNSGKLTCKELTCGNYYDGIYEIEVDMPEEEFHYELAKKACMGRFMDHFYTCLKEEGINTAPEYETSENKSDWRIDFERFTDEVSCISKSDDSCYIDDFLEECPEVDITQYEEAYFVDSD